MKNLIAFVLLLLPLTSFGQEYLDYVSPVAKYLKGEVSSQGDLVIAKKDDLNPENEQSHEILHANDYNRLVRFEANFFTNKVRGDGQQIWVMYRNKVTQNWELIARLDTLDRYDVKDQRATGGVVRHFGKKNLRIEVSKAVENVLFANSTVEVEYVTPVTKKLVGYIGVRKSDYDSAGVANLLAYVASEYYIPGNNMIFAKLNVSQDKYNVGVKERSTTGLVRFTHFVSDFDRLYVFAANGSDNVLRSYNNTIATAKGSTFGAGYSRQLRKSWLIEVMAEKQTRNFPSGKDETSVYTVALTKLWK